MWLSRPHMANTPKHCKGTLLSIKIEIQEEFICFEQHLHFFILLSSTFLKYSYFQKSFFYFL